MVSKLCHYRSRNQGGWVIGTSNIRTFLTLGDGSSPSETILANTN